MSATIRALLFDLDGTLYAQKPLRRRMAIELGLAPLSRSPRRSLELVRGLSTFRRVREELRELGCPSESLDALQYSVPAERMESSAERLRHNVEEWMHERPLRHLAPHRHPGLLEFLEHARSAGFQLGVFSDYPPRKKLEALDVARFFSLQLAATDPEVNAFKPHPRGFLHACERWELEPTQVLYIGDRRDVDAQGAAAAGMPCLLFGAPETDGFTSYPDLASEFDARVARVEPDRAGA